MKQPHEHASRPLRMQVIALGACLCASGFWPATGAAAGSGGAGGCQKAARLMESACENDVMEEFKVTFANCINFADAGQRRQCRREATTTRREDAGTCGVQQEVRRDVCSLLGEDLYDPDPLIDPAISFVDPDSIPGTNPANPYQSLEAGLTYVLRGGEDFAETGVIHTTDQIREVEGVSCRLVVDVALLAEDNGGGVEYVPIENTDDLFAQDTGQNVYYCGELSREYEDGLLDNLDGSFEAGQAFAKAGKLIEAFPAAGDAHRQEFALGEAEDTVQYLDLAAIPSAAEGGENPAFPCAPSGCVKTLETNPIDPEATESKYYRAGVGFVLAVPMEDGKLTGEREELVCAGDSLDILRDPACGIADPDRLLEALCKLSPDAFCGT